MGLAVLAAWGCDKPTGEKIADIYALKLDPTPRNIQTLRAILEDTDPDLRVTALSCLVSLRVDDAAEIAVAGLDDEAAFVRATAAKLVGDLDDPELSGFLIARMRQDPDPLVRRRACEALARVPGEDAGGAMVDALDDPDPEVRLAAIRGAKALAPGEGTGRLIELLRDDPMWEIRVQAAGALGKSGDPAAADALRIALEDPVEFVRAAASKALGDLVPTGRKRPSPEAEN
jgi:HEAT repeat protein